MAGSSVEEAIQRLRSAGASMRASDLRALLLGLGFQVDDRNNGGHKTFVHPQLSQVSDFKTGNYNAGHGRDSEVLRVYLRNVLRVLELYRSDLEKILGEKK